LSYSPITDFLSLLRQSAAGEEILSMPGLDYVVAAMARAGLFTLSVGQTAPLTNQQTTVWLKPSVPSWVAEGTVYLWNAATGAYAPATSALWTALLTPSGYLFQSVTTGSVPIGTGVTLAAIQRAAPTATILALPDLLSQWATGRPLRIVDWSTGVTEHVITLAPAGTATIMQLTAWELLSTAAQLAGVTLYPSPDLNGWVIAP
jgi:hypothetical protein